MAKKISNESYEVLISSGHCVPRLGQGLDNIVPFKVGGEYKVTGESKQLEVWIRCTQNCPYHIILIE